MTNPHAPRREDVKRQLSEGLSNKQIANGLNMSMSSVKTHLRIIMLFYGATNRTMCALMIHGIIPDRSDEVRFKRQQFLERMDRARRKRLTAVALKAAALDRPNLVDAA